MPGNETSSVATKLLELFNTLSNEFHALNTNYEKLYQLSTTGQNNSETRQLITSISKDIDNVKGMMSRIEIAMNDLVSYKNKIQDIPGATLTATESIKDDLVENLSLIKNSVDRMESIIKKIDDIDQLRLDLKPIGKLSKLIVTPVGVIALILTFVLATSSVLFGIWNIAKLWAPPKDEKIELIQLQKQIKMISTTLDSMKKSTPPTTP